MSDNTTIIAFLGKGGVGKTALSAITGKIFMEASKRVLFIDADPAEGLATALGISGYKTIGVAREEIIGHARIASGDQEKERLAEIIDYCLLESLHEEPAFSAIVMGQTNRLGCYCPINSLLRNAIGSIAEQFDVVIVDAEAGIEQVNRQVVERVNYPVIVSDNSLRSVRSVKLILDTIERSPSMNPVKTGVVFNRVDKFDMELAAEIAQCGIGIYGTVPPDLLISDFDRLGEPITSLPADSAAVQSMKLIIKGLQIMSPDKEIN